MRTAPVRSSPFSTNSGRRRPTLWASATAASTRWSWPNCSQRRSARSWHGGRWASLKRHQVWLRRLGMWSITRFRRSRSFSNYLKSAYGEENARAMTRSWAKAFGEIIDGGGDISRKSAGEIACPALLITGEQDFIAPPTAVSELAGAMQKAEVLEAKGGRQIA